MNRFVKETFKYVKEMICTEELIDMRKHVWLVLVLGSLLLSFVSAQEHEAIPDAGAVPPEVSDDPVATSDEPFTEDDSSDAADVGAFDDEDLVVDPGLTPDSPFYFFDDFAERQLVGDDPERALLYREEKLAEARRMAENGQADYARQALERAQFHGEILQANVRPEMAPVVGASTAVARRVLERIGRDVPELGETVSEQLQNEEQIGLAAELSKKIYELCDALSDLDPKRYEEACNAGEDAPEWRQQQHAQLTTEQEEHARLFAEKLGQCFDDPENCDCQGMGVQSFQNVCEEASTLEAGCQSGDQVSCLEMEQKFSDFNADDYLPDYLADTFDELDRPIEQKYEERFNQMFEQFSQRFDAEMQKRFEEEFQRRQEFMEQLNTQRFGMAGQPLGLPPGLEGEFPPGFDGQLPPGLEGREFPPRGPPPRVAEFGRDCHALEDLGQKASCFEEFYEQTQGAFRADFGWEGPRALPEGQFDPRLQQRLAQQPFVDQAIRQPGLPPPGPGQYYPPGQGPGEQGRRPVEICPNSCRYTSCPGVFGSYPVCTERGCECASVEQPGIPPVVPQGPFPPGQVPPIDGSHPPEGFSQQPFPADYSRYYPAEYLERLRQFEEGDRQRYTRAVRQCQPGDRVQCFGDACECLAPSDPGDPRASDRAIGPPPPGGWPPGRPFESGCGSNEYWDGTRCASMSSRPEGQGPFTGRAFDPACPSGEQRCSDGACSSGGSCGDAGVWQQGPSSCANPPCYDWRPTEPGQQGPFTGPNDRSWGPPPPGGWPAGPDYQGQWGPRPPDYQGPIGERPFGPPSSGGMAEVGRTVEYGGRTYVVDPRLGWSVDGQAVAPPPGQPSSGGWSGPSGPQPSGYVPSSPPPGGWQPYSGDGSGIGAGQPWAPGTPGYTPGYSYTPPSGSEPYSSYPGGYYGSNDPAGPNYAGGDPARIYAGSPSGYPSGTPYPSSSWPTGDTGTAPSGSSYYPSGGDPYGAGPSPSYDSSSSSSSDSGSYSSSSSSDSGSTSSSSSESTSSSEPAPAPTGGAVTDVEEQHSWWWKFWN